MKILLSIRQTLLVFILVLPSAAFSQDGISFFFQPDTTRKQGISYTLSYTSRRSIINENAVAVRGVHGGIRFGKNRNRLSIAYFWCNTNPDIKLLDFSSDRNQLMDLSGFLNKDFHYYNVMYYPYWVNTSRWRMSTPLEIGIGRFTQSGLSIFKDLAPYEKDSYFVPLQFGGYIEYKAMRHFGVNFELGYRSILKEKNIPFPLSGVYYGLGLNVYLGTIWRDLHAQKG